VDQLKLCSAAGGLHLPETAAGRDDLRAKAIMLFWGIPFSRSISVNAFLGSPISWHGSFPFLDIALRSVSPVSRFLLA
jgi:hypothetical protein